MSKYLNDAYTLRIPAELKAKVQESAKELNRSMNADIVARLEESFIKANSTNLNEIALEDLISNVLERLNTRELHLKLDDIHK